MAILVPASKIDAAQVTAMRLALRAKLTAAVAGTMGQSVIIRDLAAYDISGVAAVTALYARLNNKAALVARTWDVNDLGTVTLGVNQAIGIYGYVALSAVPLIDAISFTLGGVVTLAQFWLAPIYAEEYSAIGYFNPPVVYGPQQSIQVNLLSEVAIAATVESYALLGYTCEPAGKTVQADQTNLV
jgi:hypothetical protein